MSENVRVGEGGPDKRGSQMVSVRLAVWELDAIKRTAAQKDDTVSGFIRTAALRASGVDVGPRPVVSTGTTVAANTPVVTNLTSGVIVQISIPGGAASPQPIGTGLKAGASGTSGGARGPESGA